MDTTASPLAVLKDATKDALAGLADTLPAIVAAVVILIVGWLLARLARKGAQRFSAGTSRLIDRVLRRSAVSSDRLSQPIVTVAGELAFWLILLVAAVVAVRVAGLDWIMAWLDRLIVHLPNLIAGLAILILGYFTSVYLREWAGTAARERSIEPDAAIGRWVQVFILAVTLVIGLDQIGIDVAILVVAFAIVAGAGLIGLVAAFALGARDHVANLIGARHVRSVLRPGLRVRIGEVEGEVLETSATHIILEAAEGRLLLPASLADSQAVLVVIAQESDRSDNV